MFCILVFWSQIFCVSGMFNSKNFQMKNFCQGVRFWEKPGASTAIKPSPWFKDWLHPIVLFMPNNEWCLCCRHLCHAMSHRIIIIMTFFHNDHKIYRSLPDMWVVIFVCEPDTKSLRLLFRICELTLLIWKINTKISHEYVWRNPQDLDDNERH